MDSVKARLFIKDLIYDLGTVRYLLDYNRIKETLPVLEKVLNNIDSFRTNNSENDLNDIFSEDFWNKKLPPGTSFSEIRARISKGAHSLTSIIDKDLEEFAYIEFVENIFNWAEENISRIRNMIKSPTQKKIEKLSLYGVLLIIGSCILCVVGWSIFTSDWGLYGEFYKGMNFEQKVSSGIKKVINFDDYSQMNDAIQPEQFSARWDGYLVVPQDLQYTFYLFINDGGRLFIDGTPIIDQWHNHPGTEFNKKIFLAKGKHSIRVDFYNDCCDLALKLYWEPEGGSKEIISEKYLRVK